MQQNEGKLRISEKNFGVRHFGAIQVLVGCDNIILGKRWNV